MASHKVAGFTLIELMITVAIVALLSMVAYPSYVSHVQRAKRAEARTALLEAAQYLQRFLIANDRYDRDRNGALLVLPQALTTSPKNGAPAYLIRLVPGTLSRDAFMLEAVPVGSDKCGTLRLDQAGRRSIHDAPAPVTVAECWK